MRKAGLLPVSVALIAVAPYAQPAPSTQNGPASTIPAQASKPVPPANPAGPILDKDGVYELGPGIEPPVLLNPTPVTGSQDAIESCTPSMVRFPVVIGVDGTAKVRDAFLARPHPCADLVIPVLQQSKFQPGTLDGKPVPVLVCIRVPFLRIREPIPRIGPCAASFERTDSAAPDPFRLPPGARAPVPIKTVVPEFTDEARRAHHEGVVLVSMIVNEEGLPTEVQVERSAGMGLDEKAVEAVSQYRFEPAMLDGKPIAARVRVEVSFRLWK